MGFAHQPQRYQVGMPEELQNSSQSWNRGEFYHLERQIGKLFEQSFVDNVEGKEFKTL